MQTFSIIGGDVRFSYLCKMLSNSKCNAKIYGNSYSDTNTDTLAECLENSDIVIAPIPVIKNKEKSILNLTDPDIPEITISQLFNEMRSNGIQKFIGGVVSPEIRETGKEYNIDVYDFFDNEYVALMNAVPTAEGAIKTALEQSDRTIFESKILVTGYGRCAKALCKLLKSMGADCTATYRNSQTLANIKSDNIAPISFNSISKEVSDKDFIFNTIPHLVFDEQTLSQISKNCIIIDIAQAPGGIDYSAARTLQLKAFYCPGLPGRTAPRTAAEILKTAVLDITT